MKNLIKYIKGKCSSLSERLREVEGRLSVRESRIKELLDRLMEADKRFRTYILPPLPHEILSFIHALSDLIREQRIWLDELADYRKAISEVLKK